MIKRHMMLALIGTALVAAPALAQSPSGSSNTNSSPPAASAPSSPSGSSAAAPSSSMSGGSQFVTQAQSGQWRASKFVGVDIYGTDNAKIGDVSEVLLDKSGKAEAIVIGVGGFLGVGSKDVAVPFSAVQWKDQPAPSTASSNTSGARTTTGSGSAMSPGASSPAATTTSAPKILDYPDHGVLSMTKDQLKDAPEFKYASDMSKSTASSTTATPTPRPAPAPAPAAPAGSTSK